MKDLDNIKEIERIDSLGMAKVIAEFPQQIEQAFSLGQTFSLDSSFAQVNNIVFCGMGGSAIGAEVVSYYLREEINLPIVVNRDYTLPSFVNRQSLVILLSYSGNTEETLSAYAEAKKAGCTQIVVMTSGGQLAELAKKDRHPSLIIPSGLPPRGALALLSFPVLACLAKIGLIKDQRSQVEETVSFLEKLNQESLGVAVPEESNSAKQLALELFNNFAVIYAGHQHLSSVVTRWRGQLAENSKMLSSSHVLPEMNHNEIVGWQHPQELLKSFLAVFLRDKADHPKVGKRIEISKEILEKTGVKVREVWSSGERLLARTFSLIYTGDYISLYLALLNAEDPTPVKRIDYLKKRLKELA